MAETPPIPDTESQVVPPFVTIVMDKDKGEQFVSNIKPEVAPAILWLLMWGIFQLMTGKLKPVEKSSLITPNGNMNGMLKRMGIGR